MKILFTAPGYKPAFKMGGPAISVSETAEKLVKRGHDVSVFATNSNLDEDLDVPTDRPVDVNGVKVWYFHHIEPLKRLFPFIPYLSGSSGYLYAPKMRSALEKVAPSLDLIHVGVPFIYPTYIGAKIAVAFNKPFFYTQHGILGPVHLQSRVYKKMPYIWFVEKPIMRKASTLIALNEFEVQSYRLLGISTKCEIIPNGINANEYRLEPGPGIDKRFGISSQDNVILFLGRIIPFKGVELLLEAFIAVHNHIPNTTLVIAGSDDVGFEKVLKRRSRKERIGEHVIFPGMVSGDDKLDLLARADLFCLPSNGEGFSMAVLEALASATPVLISPQCNFPEVETEEVGRIVANEPDILAKAMGELLSQPNKLCEMGRRGRIFVEKKYSWNTTVSRLESIYKEGIERQ